MSDDIEDWSDMDGQPEDTGLVEVIQAASQLLPSINGQHSNELRRVFGRLNKQQLRFITLYSECKSKAEAGRRLGINRGTYDSWGSVIDYAISCLERDPLLVTAELLRVHTSKATMVIAAAMDDPDPAIRLQAAKLLLDHAVGKPQTKHTSTQDITIKLYGTALDVDRV